MSDQSSEKIIKRVEELEKNVERLISSVKILDERTRDMKLAITHNATHLFDKYVY